MSLKFFTFVVYLPMAVGILLYSKVSGNFSDTPCALYYSFIGAGVGVLQYKLLLRRKEASND